MANFILRTRGKGKGMRTSTIDYAIRMRGAALGAALALTACVNCYADEVSTVLEDAVIQVLKRAHPDARLRADESLPSIRTFAVNQRRFTVYRLDKIGNWQAPRITTAPDRGGISLRFRVEPGPYDGPLIIPHHSTNDLHVFKQTIIVKNSTDARRHLWVEILTPRVDSPDELTRSLIDLFLNFDGYYRDH
jgi:hypothetical protein